ncbi:ribonuclease P [Candidatus Woesearchaeota archaeon]|nr:ribonuclease P [Candidatus Woesearchaeota archaeon]
MKLPKSAARAIARERINALFAQAAEVSRTRPDLANRYVTLARKLSMRYKARIPPNLKRRICSHCYQYLVSGMNARIRTREGKLVISCLSCKKYTRLPLKIV